MAKRMKEKTAAIKEKKDKRPYAVAKHIRISPTKVRAVLDLIRGKSYREALGILNNIQKGACLPVKKVLNSAAANAEHNLGMNKEELFVAKCYADGGEVMKRVQPRAQGRAFRILKRTSHITIVLDKIVKPETKKAANTEKAESVENKPETKKTEKKTTTAKKPAKKVKEN